MLRAHALTGCDTVSQFFGIGKGTVMKIMSSGCKLNELGNPSASMEDIVKECTAFIAKCYGSPDANTMSTARYSMWLLKTGKRSLSSAPLLKTLPPTSESFEEHVKRAHLQAATQYGWSLDERAQVLDPVPLPPDVSPAALDVLHMIKCGCSAGKPCSSTRCGCYAAHMPCSIFCKCRGELNCYNRSDGLEHDDDDDNCDIPDQND